MIRLLKGGAYNKGGRDRRAAHACIQEYNLVIQGWSLGRSKKECIMDIPKPRWETLHNVQGPS